MLKNLSLAGATFAAFISVTGCAAIDAHPAHTAQASALAVHDLTCPASTGTLISATGSEQSVAGRCYSKEDIDRTGATTLAGALRQMDPTITIR